MKSYTYKKRKRKREQLQAVQNISCVKPFLLIYGLFSEAFCKTNIFAFLFLKKKKRLCFILIGQLKFLDRDLTCLIVNTITDLGSNFVTLCKIVGLNPAQLFSGFQEDL